MRIVVGKIKKVSKQNRYGAKVWIFSDVSQHMCLNTGWPKKPHTILLSISLLNIDRFS